MKEFKPQTILKNTSKIYQNSKWILVIFEAFVL